MDKNLLGSTLCLHWTGGTGWIFERLSVQVWDLLFSGPKLALRPFCSEWCMLINNTRRQVFPKVPKVPCNRQSFTKSFDLITALFKKDETGLMRNRFYFCRCVVVIYDAKVIYRFAISSPYIFPLTSGRKTRVLRATISGMRYSVHCAVHSLHL